MADHEPYSTGVWVARIEGLKSHLRVIARDLEGCDDHHKQRTRRQALAGIAEADRYLADPHWPRCGVTGGAYPSNAANAPIMALAPEAMDEISALVGNLMNLAIDAETGTAKANIAAAARRAENRARTFLAKARGETPNAG